MEHLHRLLRRQARRHLNLNGAAPGELEPFLEAVSAAYRQADDDREMLERSLELSSRELMQANDSLKKVLETLEVRVAERTRELVGANERLMAEIDERKRLEAQLRSMALTDALTGLANRTLLLERIERAVQRGKRRKDYLFSVLFIDLDDFNMINESLGHLVGDEVLRQISARFTRCVRTTDTVARFGGDEFIVILEDVTNYRGAIKTLRRLMAEMERPVSLGDQDLHVGGSVGLVFNIFENKSPEELIRMAEVAMQHVKAKHKGRYRVYSPKTHEHILEQFTMVKDLGEAVTKGELFLTYQPIITAESGVLAGFEALIRWNHPRYGMVMPGTFIPLAETFGKIAEIERWKIRQACADLADWRKRYQGSERLSMALNISTRYLTEAPLDVVIQRQMEMSGVPPECLVLEITETSLMHSDRETLRKLERLRGLGVRISIDDFGTGYSSLSYIQRLPLDELKVDISFVRPLGIRPENREIVRAILALAEGLGLSTVAEGVENETQRDILRELGCHLFQGYLFARPAEKGAVEAEWLSALPLSGQAASHGMPRNGP